MKSRPARPTVGTDRALDETVRRPRQAVVYLPEGYVMDAVLPSFPLTPFFPLSPLLGRCQSRLLHR